MAITPPTFVAPDFEGPTWDTTTSPRATTAFSTNPGDIMVALMAQENTSGSPAFSVASNPPGAVNWSFLGLSSGAWDFDAVAGYSVAVGDGGSRAVQLTYDAGQTSYKFGLTVCRFTGSSGTGAQAASTYLQTDGDPAFPFTTQYDNSAIAFIVADWNARPLTTRVPRQVNGVTPTEIVYFTNSLAYTVVAYVVPDAGVAGLKTLGFTTTTDPTKPRCQIAAVEVRGTGAATTPVGLLEDGTGILLEDGTYLLL